MINAALAHIVCVSCIAHLAATQTNSVVTQINKSNARMQAMLASRERLQERLPRLALRPFDDSQYEYQCGKTNSTANFDAVLSWSYDVIRFVIRKISMPFDHKSIISDTTLTHFNAKYLWKDIQENSSQVLDFEKYYIVISGIFLLVTALFLIVYILYACCRIVLACRQKHLARVKDSTQQHRRKMRIDKKHDSCKRKTYTTVLAVITIILIVLCVCTLLAHHSSHVGAAQVPVTLRSCANDVDVYRKQTIAQIEKLFISDYTELNVTLLEAIDRLSEFVIARLKRVSGAEALDTLREISNVASHTQSLLYSLETDLDYLEEQVGRLYNNLTRLRRNGQQHLTTCINQASNADRRHICERARDIFNQYDELPERLTDLSEIDTMRASLRRIQNYNASALLAGAQDQFNQLQISVQKEVISKKDDVRDLLNEIGKSLAQRVDDIRSYANKYAIDQSIVDERMRESENYYSHVENWRYVAGFLLLIPLSVMIILLMFGVIYGWCGHRPSYYDGDCCVKSTGAAFYCAAIWFGLVFLIALSAIVVGLFAIGVHTEWLLCDVFDRPTARPDMMQLAERARRLNDIDQQLFGSELAATTRQVNLTSIVERCARNETLYSILKIDAHLPVQNIGDFRNEAYAQLQRQLNQFDSLSVERGLDRLIPDDVERILNDIANESVRPIPVQIIESLRAQADELNVLNITSALRSEVDKLPIDDVQAVRQLLAQVQHIDQESATPLRINISALADKLVAVNEQLPRLTAQVPELVLSLKHAQSALQTNLTSMVRESTQQAVGHLLAYIDEYIAHVNYALASNVTSCATLRSIGRSSVDVVCRRTLDASHVYWATLAMAVLFTLPAMLLATSLKDLYCNTEPYTGIDYDNNLASPRQQRRLNAFLTDTYDHRYRAKTNSSGQYGYTQWRNDSGSSSSEMIDTSQLDDFGATSSPPPPYHTYYINTAARRL